VACPRAGSAAAAFPIFSAEVAFPVAGSAMDLLGLLLGLCLFLFFKPIYADMPEILLSF
jgi:hypothetical protein